MELMNTKLQNGVWEGQIQSAGEKPDVVVHLNDQALHDVSVTPDGPNLWRVRGNVPVRMISDGVHVCRIKLADGTDLGQFSLIAGEATHYDIRAELELLRAELALLKKAFRSHVRETM